MTGNRNSAHVGTAKKIRAVHAKEKQQIRERAATRTALTCYLRHLNQVRVRIFYEKFGLRLEPPPCGRRTGYNQRHWRGASHSEAATTTRPGPTSFALPRRALPAKAI